MNPQSYNLAIPYANKRNQILEEKYTEIERENRILLEKITNIMHQRPGTVWLMMPSRETTIIIDQPKSAPQDTTLRVKKEGASKDHRGELINSQPDSCTSTKLRH